ncbi:MAG: MATE family efflux transporter [Kiritimatiellia bacterium]
MEKIHQKSEEFDKENIYRLLIRYSLPATVGVAAFTVYNIIDRIFIGHAIGPLALSGLTVTFPLFMVCIAIGMLFGIGGGTLISLRLGERKYTEAENILGNVFAMFIIGGIAVGILGLIFLEPILLFFGATETTLPYAASYMGLLLWFLPADFLAMGTNSSLRAEGNPRISMCILIVGALLNIILDYIFIFPLNMGIFGAALATGLSKMMSAAWIITHFRIGKHRALTLHIKNLKPRLHLIQPMLAIGLSPFLIQLIASLSVALLNKQLLHYSGEVAIGAMGAVFSIMTLLNMPVWGLVQGSQPVIGFNYGAGNYKRVYHALRACLLYAGGIGLAGLLICQSFPVFLIGLFGRSDPQFIEIGSHGMRLFLCVLPIMNLNMIGIQFFQATGRPRYSIALNILKNICCLIPALFLLPKLIGLDGVWLAYPCCDLGAFIFVGAALLRERRKLTELQYTHRLRIAKSCFDSPANKI